MTIAAVQPIVIGMPQFVGKEFAGQILVRYMREPDNDPNCWSIIGQTENEDMFRVKGYYVGQTQVTTSVKRIKTN